jgi:hypothetical protein
MAFLGDFGKIFLGGASTGQVVSTGAQLLGANPVTASGIGSVAQGAADKLSTVNSEQGQSVAISQATQTLPQETGSSGSNVNNLYGGFLTPASFSNIPVPPGVTNTNVQPANLPSIFMGGGAILSGAAAVIDLFFTDPITGETKRKKITRKFKSQVKQSVMLLGIEETANMLNTTPETVVQILLKRFRNDGAYITKAAVRKTRATVRKMEQVNMLTKDIAKLAGASARRTTARTRSTTGTSRKTTVIQ